ncbi:MAG: TRAP transporter small permease [Betaproteobacteria bacterium]|jgi:TRAP-type transport system small permease protein|nr:TRAP transporter small permease [Betaproteobacteria bacterium]
MKFLSDLFFKTVEVLLVVFLSAMVVMVFGNVVLRYGFNSGIISSEELSRFLFIWITFLGAIIAVREGTHLGLDTVVRMLPRTGKVICLVLSELLMLLCCGLMFYGTWKQHPINATNMSAVVEIPMSWVYGVGYVASISMSLLIIAKLIRLARGDISDDELIQVMDSEDDAKEFMQGAKS